jgi:hypothetical protein
MPVITMNEIKAIPAVPATKTWNPIHHEIVIDEIDYQLKQVGVHPISKHYEANRSGSDLFATYTMEPMEEYQFASPQIGFRNSMDKKFALGIVTGFQILVCSNMCFSGKFINMRKHTSGIMRDLPFFVKDTINMVINSHERELTRYESLGIYKISDNEFKLAGWEMMERGIINPSSFNSFRNSWKEELEDQEGCQTLRVLHGTATRVLRNKSLNMVQSQSQKLTRFINDRVENYPLAA